MRSWNTVWLWPLDASDRFRRAIRRYWRRILVGAFVGWIFATIGGAFALASLEFWGFVSMQTSDELGIATVLAGVGLGALIAYSGRVEPQPSMLTKRR